MKDGVSIDPPVLFFLAVLGGLMWWAIFKILLGPAPLWLTDLLP